MRYFLRTVIGLGLLVAAIVAISYSVYQMLGIGTCASGGPYVVARECPSGTERLGLAIPVSVLVMLLGVAIYSTRGRAPGSDRDPDGAVGIAILWAGLFLGIAFACFWGVWGPDAHPGPGGKTGGLIVGFLFVPMGILGVFPIWSAARMGFESARSSGVGVREALATARDARGTFAGLMDTIDRQAKQQAIAQAAGGSGSTSGHEPPQSVTTFGEQADVVSELERLGQLRNQGVIDEAEFARLKSALIKKAGG